MIRAFKLALKMTAVKRLEKKNAQLMAVRQRLKEQKRKLQQRRQQLERELKRGES